MLPLNLRLLLAGCTVVMGAIMGIQMKWYSIRVWKSIPMALLLMGTGLAGALLLFFVENGFFGGRSLFGSIFLVPIVFSLVALLLKIPYGVAMDLCAPNVCVTLGFTKLLCVFDGCCAGRILLGAVRFPSQIVEMCLFFGLAVLLLWMSKQRRFQKQVYPNFLVLYSVPRFILSYLRESTQPFLLGLPPGAFWSVLALLIGCGWTAFHKAHQESVRDD